jgi:uncharacterized repeat protein (TIGR01451 family)
MTMFIRIRNNFGLTNFKEAGMQQKNKLGRRIAASTAALSLVLCNPGAFAAINNTVTASGTSPAGAISQNANESVDVANPIVNASIVKTWSFTPSGDVNNNGLVDAGDTIQYTYVVTNTGNVTLSNVDATDIADDAAGAPISITTPTLVTTDSGTAAPGQQAAAGQTNDSSDAGNTTDGDWETLGPSDSIVFTATYVVQPGDLTATTSTDGDIDSTARVTGTYVPATGPSVPLATGGTREDTEAVPLNIAPALFVDKVASDTTDVAAGDTITYTYTVRNDGNVPLTNVTLADTHNGVAGALVPAFQSFTVNNGGSTNTGNTLSLLAPGDEAEFTATYVVTQTDINNRQ